MARISLRDLSDNPVVVALTIVASVLTIVAFFQTCGIRPSPCDDVIGRWDWLIATGGVVVIEDGGGARWEPPNPGLPPQVGTWTCRSGTITVTWDSGFVDTLEISEDRERLTGTNNASLPISARRSR